MQITSKELRKKFKDEFDGLTQIWLRNKEYVTPTIDELKEVVDKYVCDLPIIQGFNECENFALFLHADVKKYIVKINKVHYNWAFGDFICKKESIFGTGIHTACICLCEEGFVIIEPMENNKIITTINEYKPFFINLM